MTDVGGVQGQALPVGPAVARNLRITLAATAALGAAGFLSGILSNRLLGPSGRGQLAAVQTAPALLATVGALGAAESLVYNATRAPDRSRSLLSAALAVALGGSVLAIGLGWIALPVILRAQPDETLQIARAYLLGLPLLVLVLVVPGVLRARGDFVHWNVLRIAPGLLWAAVVVFAVTTGRDSVRLLVYGHLVLLLVLMVPVFVLSYRRATGSPRPHRDQTRQLLRFGLPTAGQTLPQLLNLRLDQFVIAAQLSATQLGLYAASVNWVVAITLVMDACGFVLFPSLAAIADDEERRRRFAQSARLAVAAALALAIVIGALTPLFLTRVLGAEFEPAIPSALVLVVANAVLGWSRVMADGVRGLGAPGIALVAELAGLAVMATSLALLLGPYEIEGAAVSSLVGYTTIAVVITAAACRRFGFRPVELVLFRPPELVRAVHAFRPGTR